MGVMKKLTEEIKEKALQGKSAMIQIYKKGFINLRNVIPVWDIEIADDKIEIESDHLELEVDTSEKEIEYISDEDCYEIHDNKDDTIFTIALL